MSLIQLQLPHAVTAPHSAALPPTNNTRSKLFQALESCSTMTELKQYQSQIVKMALLSDNDAMGRVIKFCALSDFGDFNYALQLFDKMPQPDAFLYNIVFRGFVEAQLGIECILFYRRMLEQSSVPNKFSFPPLIGGCCICNGLEEGRQVHAHVVKHGLGSDGYSQNSLIHMYASFGCLEEARTVFDRMLEKTDASWTTMIKGYAKWGYADKAFDIFESMQDKSLICWNAMIAVYVKSNRFREAFSLFNRMLAEKQVVDKFVAASMLTACAGLGALRQGEWIHDHIRMSGIQVDSKLSTAVIDMYCKCGCLEKALEAFDYYRSEWISAWNCMIGGLAMHGKGKAAIQLFKEMEKEELTPDHITFVNLLNACAHSGLVEEGRFYFQYMTEVYQIEPLMEHYGCLVDLLGRASLLEEARDVIKKMPMTPDVSVIGALLGACRVHRNIELGEATGKQIIQMDSKSSGHYVSLANLYAHAGRWADVATIRKMMNDRGVKKAPGFSLIELEGVVNEFIAGERAHPQAKEIYLKVDEILDHIRGFGYVPDANESLHDITDDGKMYSLYHHSEKLAVACGLLNTQAGETLRITKNLRVCKDCHQACKFISMAYNREIIIRDIFRFHHFKGGLCSCNDYW